MADERILSSNDVCLILKACGESGVRVLKFADLYIQFGKTKQETLAESQETASAALAPEAAISEIQIKEATKALEREELAYKQDLIAQMRIEDPVMAEKLLLAGELEDDDTGFDDEA
jgi:hypothetical protein